MDTQELFITESWLRENCKLQQGSTLHVLENAKFTPAAYGLITDRKIRVRFGDRPESLLDRVEKSEEKSVESTSKTGSIEIRKEETSESPSIKAEKVELSTLKTLKEELKQEILKEVWRDFALMKEKETPKTLVAHDHDGWTDGRCALCHQAVSEKEPAMTHMGQHQLVAKTDAKLRVHGKLESAIAQIGLLCAQIKISPLLNNNDFIPHYLTDLRSLLIELLDSIKSSTIFVRKIDLAGLDAEGLSKIAKNPLKYLGQDHFVSDGSQGLIVAQLDVLRTHIRELELEAASVYVTHDFKVLRQDVMEALNIISHAIYVLMLFVLVSEKKNTN